MDPNTTFDNQPEGWLLLWCPGCLYSVVWTEDEWSTYTEAEWDTLLWREAVPHDCPARIREDDSGGE